MPIAAKPQKIRVNTIDAGWVNLDGEVLGPFGIHAPLSDDEVGWVVSHLATGCRCGLFPFKRKADARRYANLLVRLGKARWANLKTVGKISGRGIASVTNDAELIEVSRRVFTMVLSFDWATAEEIVAKFTQTQTTSTPKVAAAQRTRYLFD